MWLCWRLVRLARALRSDLAEGPLDLIALEHLAGHATQEEQKKEQKKEQKAQKAQKAQLEWVYPTGRPLGHHRALRRIYKHRAWAPQSSGPPRTCRMPWAPKWARGARGTRTPHCQDTRGGLWVRSGAMMQWEWQSRCRHRQGRTPQVPQAATLIGFLSRCLGPVFANTS